MVYKKTSTLTRLRAFNHDFGLVTSSTLQGLFRVGIPDTLLEDVSINNEYEYENDFKPYSYSKSFSQHSMLTMTPNFPG